MDKVRVTQEQADWLERFELSQTQIDYYIDIHPLNKRPDSPVTDWTTSKLARALYIGYEVESEYKVGEYIRDINLGITQQVTKGMLRYLNKGSRPKDTVRYATPEEITEEKESRWWMDLGRGVNEYREGDLVRTGTSRFVEVLIVYDSFNLGVGNGFDIFDITVDGVIDLMCLGEDRKDVKE